MTSSLRARITGSTLLVSAVALIVALDTGLVPLPYSTPRQAPAAAASAAGVGRSEAAATGDPVAGRAVIDAIAATVSGVSAAISTRSDTAGYVHRSAPAVTAALARLVRNVAAVPGATASLDRRGPVLARPGKAGDVTVQLSLISRFVPNEPAADELIDAGFRKVGERWLLVSWAPIVDPDVTTPQTPFLQPVDVVAVRKPHALVLGTARSGRLNARLAARAESAAVQARAVLPEGDWDGTVVVYAFVERAFLDRVFGPRTAGLRDPSPYSWWSSVTDGGALRVTLGAGYVAVDDARSRFGVKAAVGYAAGLAADGTGVPEWMIRGMSEYVATRSGGDVDPDAALERRGLFDGTWRALSRGTWTPTLLAEEAENTPDAQREAATDAAWLGWLYLTDRYGEARMRKAWTAAAESTESLEAAERAALSALGTTRASVVRDLRTWTRRLAARA